MSRFTQIADTPLAGLGCRLQDYHHPCGLIHQHLACADPHRAALWALRTPPADDSGLPHICEHLTLCGSQRYPVRDPFFLMLRRSLCSDLNACTLQTATWYHFATTNARDFDHLLAVISDALFAPLLTEERLAAEACRLVPPVGPHPARFDGVVFNEMCGAMASSEAQMDQALRRSLDPTGAGGRNSGGEPTVIPTCDLPAVRHFHQTCYRPDDACLITYGALDPAWVQAALSPYLSDRVARPLAPSRSVPLRADAPQTVSLAIPDDAAGLGHCLLAWSLGASRDATDRLRAQWLDELLLGHDAAPLRQALEASACCESLGASGLSNDGDELLFLIEGRGIRDQSAFAATVERCLADLLRSPPDVAASRRALCSLERAHRRALDHPQRGLLLAQALARAWAEAADAEAALDPLPSLQAWRAHLEADPQRIAACLHELLGRAPLRRIIGRPDPTWHERLQQDLAAQAAQRWQALSPSERRRLQAQEATLAAHLPLSDPTSSLPMLTPADLGPAVPPPLYQDQAGWTLAAQPCQGLATIILAMPLPDCGPEQAFIAGLWGLLFARLGAGATDAATTCAELAETCGSLGARIDFALDGQAWLIIQAWSEATSAPELLRLMHRQITEQHYRDHDRIASLLAEYRRDRHDELADPGSGLAIDAALAAFSGPAGLADRHHGLAFLHQLTTLTTAQAIAQLNEFHAPLRSGHFAACLIADEPQRILPQLPALPVQRPHPSGPAMTPQCIGPAHRHLACPSPLYAQALVLPAPCLSADSAGALLIAARLLGDGSLHHRLRERGGAYECDAQYRGGSGFFLCASARDPRHQASLADMRAAIAELAAAGPDPRNLEEARIAAIAQIDRPLGPSQHASQHWLDPLLGRDSASLQQLRAQVLACDATTLRAAVAALPHTGASASLGPA